MRWRKISDAVVRRLPLYLRVLDEVSRDDAGRRLMSSQELGERAGVSPALVRKDLAWFGEFGKQGVGYEIAYLRTEVRRILNLDHEVRVGLVGVGQLGHAFTRYHRARMARDQEFQINLIALFDNDPQKCGQDVDGLIIRPVSELQTCIAEMGLHMVVITVPAPMAQDIANKAVKAGIKALLNFAPVKLVVSPGVHVANADLTLELQRLAYYLEV